jgi:hypothetical protein
VNDDNADDAAAATFMQNTAKPVRDDDFALKQVSYDCILSFLANFEQIQ